MVDQVRRADVGHFVVWSWWAHDARMGADLVFAVAVAHRAQISSACRRVRVAEGGAERIGPGQSGYAAALRHSGQLVWTPLDRFPCGEFAWRDEQQLTVARRVGLAGLGAGGPGGCDGQGQHRSAGGRAAVC